MAPEYSWYSAAVKFGKDPDQWADCSVDCQARMLAWTWVDSRMEGFINAQLRPKEEKKEGGKVSAESICNAMRRQVGLKKSD